MEKFSRTLHGYNPKEVNSFLDNIISQVEQIIKASKQKDVYINNLEQQLKELDSLKASIDYYKRMEENLNKTVELADDK